MAQVSLRPICTGQWHEKELNSYLKKKKKYSEIIAKKKNQKKVFSSRGVITAISKHRR